MTGKPRKPQCPPGTNVTRVRQQTGWQDDMGRWPGSILRGSRPVYDRLPKENAPIPSVNPSSPTLPGE